MALDDPRIQTAKKLHADKGMVVADICKTLQISWPTLYRWLSVNPPVGGTDQAEGKSAASA
jgi:phage antirepressor YoqD-like protein